MNENDSGNSAIEIVPRKSNAVKEFLDKFPKWREAVFLTSVAGISMLFGFGAAFASAKKQDPEGFEKGISATRKFEGGVALASRALKWGTFYAVTGCGLLFFGAWKLMGVKDLQEFRQKAGEILPHVPKNDPPQGRTEFKNLTDLLQYIVDEDNKAKADKKEREVANSSPTLIDSNISRNEAVIERRL